jgi:hypothetical protein
MSDDPAPKPRADDDALPPTALAGLAKLARERLGPEPDRAGPAAVRAMAAVVRDLKGMPEIVVQRESTHRIRIARRGKVGAIGLEYLPSIRAMELEYVGFPGADPTTVKSRRYAWASDDAGEWSRLDGGGELFGDIKEALVRLYPELGDV